MLRIRPIQGLGERSCKEGPEDHRLQRTFKGLHGILTNFYAAPLPTARLGFLKIMNTSPRFLSLLCKFGHHRLEFGVVSEHV